MYKKGNGRQAEMCLPITYIYDNYFGLSSVMMGCHIHRAKGPEIQSFTE